MDRSLSELRELVEGREARRAAVHGLAESDATAAELQGSQERKVCLDLLFVCVC